jgi:hypothetical protein
LARDLDLINLLTIKGQETLDDKRQSVQSTAYNVDAESLEDEVHPGAGGVPIHGFYDALGFPLFYDPAFRLQCGASALGSEIEPLASTIIRCVSSCLPVCGRVTRWRVRVCSKRPKGPSLRSAKRRAEPLAELRQRGLTRLHELSHRPFSRPTVLQSALWPRPRVPHLYWRGPQGPSHPERPRSATPRSSRTGRGLLLP